MNPNELVEVLPEFQRQLDGRLDALDKKPPEVQAEAARRVRGRCLRIIWVDRDHTALERPSFPSANPNQPERFDWSRACERMVGQTEKVDLRGSIRAAITALLISTIANHDLAQLVKRIEVVMREFEALEDNPN